MTILEEIRFVKKRNEILNTLMRYTEKKDYVKVESDLFEELFDFVNTNQRFDTKNFIKVEDREGNIFLLRPDITTNIIKQVIPRLNPGDSLKMYYLEKIYAYNARGKMKSKRQFGVEMIGGKSLQTEMELLSLIDGILDMYKISFYIEIGNQLFIDLLINKLTTDGSIKRKIKDALFKKNESTITALIQEESLYKTLLLNVLNPRNSITDIKSYIIENKLDEKLLKEVNRVIEISEKMNQENITLDLSLVSPYDYYNGPIFKGYIEGVSQDIFRGGRYDTLTENFGILTRALGFSLDLEPLIREVIKHDKETKYSTT